MRLGISLTSGHSSADPSAAASTMIERTIAANRAGLDHLTVGDHHVVGPNGLYMQGVPTLARLLADWPSDRPAGLLFLLPLWNPVLLAEQVGTLATIAGGSIIIQTGIGGSDAELAAMGIPHRHRGKTADRSISVIKRLLAGEVVSDDHFGLTDAAIGPLPTGTVEWWIGSGLGDAPLERAAREGDAWYVSPGVSIEELAPAIERYRARCDHHGTTPRVALRRDLVVTDDDATGVTLGDDLAARGYRGMSREQLICGGVDRVASMLAPFAEVGVNDIVARTLAVAHPVAVRSVELLGEVRIAIGDPPSGR